MLITPRDNEDKTKNITIKTSSKAEIMMVDGKWALMCDETYEDIYKYCR
jgi:hypothetical protein